jgi:ribosomal protein S18 acetylase RimI-like enzyme
MQTAEVHAPGSQAGIVPATWRDLNDLRQLERVCFPKDSWPIWDLIGVLTLPSVVRLKAVADGKMVGFVAGDVRRAEDTAWIATIGVLPAYRRRGIASRLLAGVEQRVKEARMRLSVRISNQPAIKLYQQLGYQRVGAWPGYYQDGEDALVLEKYLGTE